MPRPSGLAAMWMPMISGRTSLTGWHVEVRVAWGMLWQRADLKGDSGVRLAPSPTTVKIARGYRRTSSSMQVGAAEHADAKLPLQHRPR
jgi:hypothetical protein